MTMNSKAIEHIAARTLAHYEHHAEEFWQGTRRALKPDGVMLANLILDGKLASPYARNLLATIESAYGRCAVEVLSKVAERSNVVVACFATEGSEAARIYVDERNLADFDSTRSP